MAQEEPPVGLPHIFVQNSAVVVPIVQQFEPEEFFEEEDYFDEDYEEDDFESEPEAVGVPIQQQPVPAIQQEPIDLTPDTKTSVDQFQYGWGSVQKFFEANPDEIAKQVPKTPTAPPIVESVDDIGSPQSVVPLNTIVTERVVAVRAEVGNVTHMICRKCGYRRVMDNAFNYANVQYWMQGHVKNCYAQQTEVPDWGGPKQDIWNPKPAKPQIGKYCQYKNPTYHLHCKGKYTSNLDCLCECHTKEEFPDEVI